jgi:GDP-4-dehydro-6-deoxy-D-mannose reductase
MTVLTGRPMDPTKTRVLITGAAGFVAAYVMAALEAGPLSGPGLGPRNLDLGPLGELTVCATARSGDISERRGPFQALDITDAVGTADAINRFQPTHVIHLAGIAAPTKAGANPDLAWRVNLGGTLNVARAILAHARSATLIFAGSGLVYGDTAKSGQPLTETDRLAPNTDYAATKAAADLALGALVGQGLRVIRCRPFNHTGPGQTEDFVLPSFAAQIARIERGQQPPVLKVGNLDAMRDFLDVRDVADAYVRCVLHSARIAPGTILNIASGVPVSIRTLLDQMLVAVRVPIQVETDPARWRANDLPCFVGDATAARRALGWAPRHDFAAMTAALLEAQRTAH